MATKARRKRTENKKKKITSPAKSRRKPVPGAVGSDSASKRFVNDLLVRGEAAQLDSNGKLPLEATHVITRQDKDGATTVRRARYKLW